MKKRNTDFSIYTLHDLLNDPDFIKWVLLSEETLSVYWKTLQNDYQNLSVLVPQARQLILTLQFKENLMGEDEERQLWQQIAMRTTQGATTGRILPMWMRSAVAALLVGVLFCVAFYFYTNRKISYTTAYGQIQTIMLPDSTEVTLNANSKLQYDHHWDKKQIRQVWLTGEAFFRVNHLHRYGAIAAGDRFIVHAGKINVEVLGTTFNVNDRRGLINVALVSGKVSMGFADIRKPPLILQPGDVLEYQTKQDTIIRKSTKTTNKIAWKDRVLAFEQITAGELFDQLADIYGYKIVIKRPDIQQKKITGRFSSNNEDKLFQGISLALGVSIKKDEANHALIVQ